MPSKGDKVKIDELCDHFPGMEAFIVEIDEESEYRYCVALDKHSTDVSTNHWIHFSHVHPLEKDGAQVKRRGRKPGTKIKASASSASSTPPTQATTFASTTPSIVTYPFPLDNGQMPTLVLPAILTNQDSRRLCQMISSLVIDTEAK